MEPRQLRLGASLLRPGHAWLLIGGLLAVPAVIIGTLILVLQRMGDEERSAAELLRAAWMELLKEPGSELALWALAVAGPVAIVLHIVQRTASIRITSLGLAAHVPRWLGLGMLRQTTGDFEVLWDSVRGARLVSPSGRVQAAKRLALYRLVIETGVDEVWLNPFAWFDRAGPDHRLRIGELLRPRTVDAERRLREAPLMQVLAARGIEPVQDEPGWQVAGTGFDLARHRGIVVLLTVLFVAAAYAAVDFFVIGTWRALEPLPATPFLAAGVAAGLAAWRLGRGAPRLEHTVVGALTVVAVVAAVYPATLRLNAVTAAPEVVGYRAVASGVFEPPDPARPGIDLADLDIDEYWAGYPPGAVHEFILLRGAAGFHQLDLAPLYERTRRFYTNRR